MTVEKITKLEHPIGVMLLMHKAFRGVSGRTEALAAEASTVEDIGRLNEEFAFWIKQIIYYATVEDEIMTAQLKDSQPARDNVTEHAELSGKAGELASFIAGAKQLDWK